MKEINFEDFKKLDIRIGKIVSVEKIEESDKLLKLEVDFGSETRQIIAGIGKIYAPEALIGKECPFAYNLAPRNIMGLKSQGMILCASAPLSTGLSDKNGPVLMHPDKEIPPGSAIK